MRPDLMSPIRKTSLLYVRSDLFARLMPQLLFVIVYESESNRQRDMKFLSFFFLLLLRPHRSHSLPHFEGTTFNKQKIKIHIFIILLYSRLIMWNIDQLLTYFTVFYIDFFAHARSSFRISRLFLFLSFSHSLAS